MESQTQDILSRFDRFFLAKNTSSLFHQEEKELTKLHEIRLQNLENVPYLFAFPLAFLPIKIYSWH